MQEAAKQKSEKCVVADAVKGVHVRSATRKTKVSHGVADAVKGAHEPIQTVNNHARGRRCRERKESCYTVKCYQPATVTVTLECGGTRKYSRTLNLVLCLSTGS